MPGRILVFAPLLLIAAVLTPGICAPPDRPSPEENILRDACVPSDDDGLLAFFGRRTLSDAERKQIGEVIRRLGGDDFDDRESAAKELRQFGGRATPLVRTAAHSADAETTRRAQQFLKEVEPLAQLPAVAAARLMARRAPADAVPVLLAYLPFTDDPAVEDEVQAALLTMTTDGKPNAALVAALDDPQPAKRAAAAYVVGRKGDKDQRAVVRKRLEDVDATVRWQAASALLAAHDKAAVPVLVDLLTNAPYDPSWRAEEVLRRLAGDKPPTLWLDDSPLNRTKCRDAWAAWWKDKGDGLDLASYKEAERPLGYTLGVEYNTGRVWECDIDGSIRWEFRDLDGPMDAQVLPNGNVLVAEADAHRVTERDFKGAVLWEKKIDGDPKRWYDVEPNGCRRLPNGNTFVTTPPRAMAFAPNGQLLYSTKIETGGKGSNAIRMSREGRICYTSDGGVTEFDVAGKRLGDTPLPVGDVLYVGLEDLPGRRFLAADSRMGRVLAVTAAGTILWQADVPGACGVTRLANGHILVGANRKVIELDMEGRTVWEKVTDGYARRVYRR